MRRLIVLLIPWALLSMSCRDRRSEKHYIVTEDGYRVLWHDHGAYEAGYLTEEMVLEEFRVSMAFAASVLWTRYGVTQDVFLRASHSVSYLLVDDYTLQDTPGTCECSAAGEYAPLSRAIYLPIYRYHQGAEVPLTDGGRPVPMWTVRPHPLGYRWGYWPVDPFPAMHHEIGHVIFGPTFEH